MKIEAIWNPDADETEDASLVGDVITAANLTRNFWTDDDLKAIAVIRGGGGRITQAQVAKAVTAVLQARRRVLDRPPSPFLHESLRTAYVTVLTCLAGRLDGLLATLTGWNAAIREHAVDVVDK